MKLHALLDHVKCTHSLPARNVYCFSGKKYPVLFFSHFISFFKKNGITIDRIDFEEADPTSLKAHCAIESFEGQTIFWLNNFSQLDAKQQHNWFSFFQTYTGPHTILFFSEDQAISNDNNSQLQYIIVPDEINTQELDTISFLIRNEHTIKNNFISHMSRRTATLSLDNACLLVHYHAVLGRNASLFFDTWFDLVIEPHTSLFFLAQYFFGKNKEQFFKQWARVEQLYMPPFWITFFADQVWRANMYCTLMKQKKYAQTKKAQYKLPFSFINRDWRKYSDTELCNAHQFLCDMDFHVKNGGTSGCLDVFLYKFFENKFE